MTRFRFRPTALFVLVVSAALAGVGSPAAAQGNAAQGADAGERRFEGFTEREIEAMTPASPDPDRGFLGSAEPDYRYWRARQALEAYHRGVRRAGRRAEVRTAAPRARPLGRAESEDDGASGMNDTYATAEFIAGFGTGRGLDPVVTITGVFANPLHGHDVDVFAFDLAAGDVVGVGEGSGPVGVVTVFGPDGTLLVSASRPTSGLYPEESPLPSEGAMGVGVSLVAHAAGRYAVAVRSSGWSGPYTFEVHAFRPRTETDPEATQVLFVDVDGATIRARELFGTGNTIAKLSPLADFLPKWGLESSEERALIDRLMAALEENLVDDVRERSNNPTADIVLKNSRDHPDPGEAPFVSRLVVGGTVEELGLNALGIASSIDPGNFRLEDVGVVLLDQLSAPPEHDRLPGSAWSLNAIELAPGAEMLDLVATTVGNIMAHEAGHFLGLWHTDMYSPVQTIQDEGGMASLPHVTGTGPDFIFGTADDIDADFRPDRYSRFGPLVGVEHQLNTVAFGLSTARPVAVDRARPAPPGFAPLYPNPLAGQGVATLVIRTTSVERVRVGIYDLAGRRVRTAFEGHVAPGQPERVQIAGRGLAAGTYLVRVEGTHEAMVRRLTVVR